MKLKENIDEINMKQKGGSSNTIFQIFISIIFIGIAITIYLLTKDIIYVIISLFCFLGIEVVLFLLSIKEKKEKSFKKTNDNFYKEILSLTYILGSFDEAIKQYISKNEDEKLSQLFEDYFKTEDVFPPSVTILKNEELLQEIIFSQKGKKTVEESALILFKDIIEGLENNEKPLIYYSNLSFSVANIIICGYIVFLLFQMIVKLG